MTDLFCMGDDDWKPNVGYVIGQNKNKLYYNVTDTNSVAYVDCALHACIYEHFTDAALAIHSLYKNGIDEAINYKVYKVICQLQECENYVNEEKGNIER